MASGKAVVSTAVGGVPDLVEDKRTGWLVDSEDPAAFKDAMAALIKDEGLRRRLGEAAAAHVHGIYSSGRLIREVERLYRDMLVEKKL